MPPVALATCFVLATCFSHRHSSKEVSCSCHLVFLSVLALEMRLADLVLASGQGSSDQMYTFFNLSSADESVAIQLALRGKTITGLTKRALKVNVAGPAPPRYDPASKHGSRPKAKQSSAPMPQAGGYPFPPDPPLQMFGLGAEYHPSPAGSTGKYGGAPVLAAPTINAYLVHPPLPRPSSSTTGRPKPSMAPRFMAKPSASVVSSVAPVVAPPAVKAVPKAASVASMNRWGELGPCPPTEWIRPREAMQGAVSGGETEYAGSDGSPHELVVEEASSPDHPSCGRAS